MFKFKVGDGVIIVRHFMDSADGFELNELTYIVAVSHDPEEVKQRYAAHSKKYGTWWIAEECLEFSDEENE